MAIPSYRDVSLALLVELVRRDKPIGPSETYELAGGHFPLLTEQDRTALRPDETKRVWPNMVQWARNYLREEGLLAETGPGAWRVNEKAPRTLEDLLHQRGVDATRARTFMSGDQMLHSILGTDWATPVGAARGRPQGPRKAASPKPGPASGKPPRSSASEDLTQLQRREIERFREELIQRLNSMDPYDFEAFVGRILEGLGFSNALVVGRSGDEGVDIQCRLQNSLLVVTVAVQVKRQRANVGPKEISYLRDRWARRADKLMFITTSEFTAGAREVADDRELKPVVLVDGRQLADAMIGERIGVVPQTVTRFALDTAFFTE